MSIGCAPDFIHNLENNMQGKRKHCKLKHPIAGTVYSAMVETLAYVATSISLHYQNYCLWDKG